MTKVQLNIEILSLVVIREINATAVAEIGTALTPVLTTKEMAKLTGRVFKRNKENIFSGCILVS
jgi:hypothetical protein